MVEVFGDVLDEDAAAVELARPGAEASLEAARSGLGLHLPDAQVDVGLDRIDGGDADGESGVGEGGGERGAAAGFEVGGGFDQGELFAIVVEQGVEGARIDAWRRR